ncbi:hypothetical protein ACFX15_012806 [Malus domestica]
MSRINFIPEAKANFAWKHFNFAKIRADPRIGWASIRPPNLFQRLYYFLGFVPGPKGMLWVLAIERKRFKF